MAKGAARGSYKIFVAGDRSTEEWRRTGNNTGSIVFGIDHTGRFFTAAALVVAVSMGALVLSQVTLLMVLGATMAAVVVLDATVVRGILVPAVMQLAGRASAPPRPAQGEQPSTTPFSNSSATGAWSSSSCWRAAHSAAVTWSIGAWSSGTRERWRNACPSS